MIGSLQQPGINRRRVVTAGALAIWGAAYAAYRAYYAAGGHVGMHGRPVSMAQFRTINAVGAVIILAAAVLPLLLVRLQALQRAAPVLCWIGAVSCCMHALVDETLRLLSVTGVHPTQLPADLWRSYDRHAADLQDILFNEPWFFVEGLLWLTLGLTFVQARRRFAWTSSAVAACLVLAVIGVLSGVETIGTFRIG